MMDLMIYLKTLNPSAYQQVKAFILYKKDYQLTLSRKKKVNIKVLNEDGKVERELNGVQLKLQEDEERQKHVDKVIELVNKLN